jgi:hypothetical protein
VQQRALCSGEPALVTLRSESSLWIFDEKSLELFIYWLPYGSCNNADGINCKIMIEEDRELLDYMLSGSGALAFSVDFF